MRQDLIDLVCLDVRRAVYWFRQLTATGELQA